MYSVLDQNKTVCLNTLEAFKCCKYVLYKVYLMLQNCIFTNGFVFYCSHFFLCLIVESYMILMKVFTVTMKKMMPFFQTHKYRSTKILILIGK